MRSTFPTFVLAGALALVASACLSVQGEPCSLDSECQADMVCGIDGVCTTFAAVDEAFHAVPDVVVITLDTLSSDDGAEADGPPVGLCEPPAGTWSCAAPPQKLVPVMYTIASEGHGAAGLAGAAGLVLPGAFADGTIQVEVWVDGTLADGCDYRMGWIRGDEDVELATCTPKHTKNLPFSIPGLVDLFVYDYKFTPSTGVVTGLVDKEEILASLDVSLRPAFEPMVQENVDTDGDGEPDLSTFIMTVEFE